MSLFLERISFEIVLHGCLALFIGSFWLFLMHRHCIKYARIRAFSDSVPHLDRIVNSILIPKNIHCTKNEEKHP